MDLKFAYGEVMYSVDSIMMFANEEQTAYWSEPIFQLYPDINKQAFMAMDTQARKTYLLDFFTRFDSENKALILEKQKKYNERWQLYRTQIIQALEDAFKVDLTSLFNDMQGYITYNPICPRYLDTHTFDVFYLNSERGALGMSLHEIIHFVWFHVWHNTFQDSNADYETPHLKWILSEMVVDPIMRDERLSSINPYFSDGCAYSYFYTLSIDGKPILDTLYEMYTAMPIQDFMKSSYQFCLQHEPAIRAHIAASE